MSKQAPPKQGHIIKKGGVIPPKQGKNNKKVERFHLNKGKRVKRVESPICGNRMTGIVSFVMAAAAKKESRNLGSRSFETVEI